MNDFDRAWAVLLRDTGESAGDKLDVVDVLSRCCGRGQRRRRLRSGSAARPESGVDDFVAEVVRHVEVPHRVEVPGRPGRVEAVNVKVDLVRAEEGAEPQPSPR
jgi:hypothetical protein